MAFAINEKSAAQQGGVIFVSVVCCVHTYMEDSELSRPANLRCPECVENGQRSKVTDYGGSRFCMGWTPFYDEDGNYHAHNPNDLNVGYQCSNGHTFSRTYPNPCPHPECEFGRE